jgi:hypothetical protein
MAQSKDRLNDYYTFLLLGMVAFIFFAGYIAGSRKVKDEE